MLTLNPEAVSAYIDENYIELFRLMIKCQLFESLRTSMTTWNRLLCYFGE